MVDQFIVFDWKGKMAHFRQFDANSSSLSYSFPPPTVVMGLVAGLLGMRRDEYYDLLGPDRLKISVQIKTPPRKIMQSVNYIFAKSVNDLNMSGESPHTQIPVELLTAKDFPDGFLCYRVVLQTPDATLHGFITKALEQNRYKFLPYFGSAPFQSWLEWPGPIKSVSPILDETVIVDTTAAVESIDLTTLSMETIEGSLPAFYREHVRRFFTGDDRQPGEVMDVIWEKNRGKIKARFKTPVYRIQLENEALTACLL